MMMAHPLLRFVDALTDAAQAEVHASDVTDETVREVHLASFGVAGGVSMRAAGWVGRKRPCRSSTPIGPAAAARASSRAC